MITIAVIENSNTNLINILSKYNFEKESNKKIYIKIINNIKIILGISDIGKTNSAMITQYIIDKYKIDFIINSGVARSLNNNIKLMDLIISDFVTYHDFFPVSLMNLYVPMAGKIKAEKLLIELSEQILDETNYDNYMIAPICSGDSLIYNKKVKENIFIETGAVAMDTESASIGHVAFINKIPFISIKTIFNSFENEECDENTAYINSSSFVEKLIIKLKDYLIKNNVNKSKVYLKIPEFNELDYYINILKDEKTMNYNSGYNLNLIGYENTTGCINYFDKEKWYKRQMNDKNRFFAYIINKENNIPIGYLNFHFDEERLKHTCGLVIEYKYRNMGYAKDALKLLLDVAFNEYNIESLICSIPYNMKYALKLVTKVGFIDTKEDYYVKRFNENQRNIILEITKNDYNNYID